MCARHHFLQHCTPTSSSAVHSTPLKLERSLDIVGNDLLDNPVVLSLSRSPPYRRVVIIWHNKITTSVLPYLQSLIIVGRVHSTALKLERPLDIVGNDLFDNLVALPLSRCPPHRRVVIIYNLSTALFAIINNCWSSPYESIKTRAAAGHCW